MQTSDTARYPAGDASPQGEHKRTTDDQLRSLLDQLISWSEDLNLRVWLDGVYTDIEDARERGDWMKGREVYFKVEGRVDGLKTGVRQ